jgi:hypothetical protein
MRHLPTKVYRVAIHTDASFPGIQLTTAEVIDAAARVGVQAVSNERQRKHVLPRRTLRVRQGSIGGESGSCLAHFHFLRTRKARDALTSIMGVRRADLP